ncbi:hypothetical protein HCN44_006201 [Aphidius gifuensis]|uniref:HTTM-like domain-containing protein n=1 Tax=Aphidius gifuensis TaxID=684658 RepID=A0A834Y3Y8_APHGI|nr:vitamin K-dependent gamma-carboxylase [Aphidius gifuensis]XP_044009432.1 vitamin K-dependent gamma-carboxylase [Aphidius gifuensis]KAF7997630.1 hypothetical protein HCN44_006201 [Aphidius gifuensis]
MRKNSAKKRETKNLNEILIKQQQQQQQLPQQPQQPQVQQQQPKNIKKWKLILSSIDKLKNKFENSLNLKYDEISFDKFVNYMYKPTDAASLGVCRALFGLCMVLDVVEERGLADIDLKWGDPYGCHFPLINGMKPPSLAWMIVIYTIMWIGSFGIMLGFFFKLSCALFLIPYWYIFLLEKSYWNNHTYLYGLICLLLWGTNANRYFSIDAKLNNKNNDDNNSVPYWNYFIIKFQFFILYFIAGLKKSSKEWLEGYSMTNLSQHWVFDPFKLFLTNEQTDYFIVHWFGFIFDLTVGFWMLFDKTRAPAMFFCAAFHFMNSRLFSIGMFPYVCLATMPLFCNVEWPRKIHLYIKDILTFNNNKSTNICENEKEINADTLSSRTTTILSSTSSSSSSSTSSVYDENLYQEKKPSDGRMYDKIQKELKTKNDNNNCLKPIIPWLPRPEGYTMKKNDKPTFKKKFVVVLLLFYIGIQFFLPYSHFITKGYNNWTPGLYGYSWDMMLHSWDPILIVVRVHDNKNNEDHFIDSQAWVPNDRWTRHGDMVIQYGQCLKKNILRRKNETLKYNNKKITTTTTTTTKTKTIDEWNKISSNISIYVDIRYSLNGRFQQRIFDPTVDILKVNWNPFKNVNFLMPLLTQFSSYRKKMNEITKHVYSWSNYTDVIFVADYPGTKFENFFNKEFTNVSLQVLTGEVTYSEESWNDKITVNKNQRVIVATDKLHYITTTSVYPACYMYTYTNRTKEELEINGTTESPKKRTGFPLLKELKYRINNWWQALGQIANAFLHLIYDVPMMRRVPKTPNYHDNY